MVVLVSECEPGWTYLAHTERCYKHDSTKRMWQEALESCQNTISTHSASLASIGDKTTNDFLSSISGSQWTWLGGFQDAEENWHWIDGSDWTGFTKWGSRQPDNNKNLEHHLGFMDPAKGLWNDFQGDHHKICSICQYVPGGTYDKSYIVSDFVNIKNPQSISAGKTFSGAVKLGHVSFLGSESDIVTENGNLRAPPLTNCFIDVNSDNTLKVNRKVSFEELTTNKLKIAKGKNIFVSIHHLNH